ncbi:MAG TPA: phosphoribosyltransferase family protein [Saprospiraceae bacterium]|nr:phosphoribosyltransferase family protein [Saprospiraceae bacterium]
MRPFYQTILSYCSGLIDAVLSVLYPSICLSCDRKVSGENELFCVHCSYQVEPTDLFLHEENSFTQQFKLRVDIERAAALYYYHKAGRIKDMMELLKYKGRSDIGIRLGLHFGPLLQQSHFLDTIDGIIPVPLHEKKRALRGYNQSELFAQGLSDACSIPVFNNVLKRIKETKTQTEKDRKDRLESMRSSFQLVQIKQAQGKHLLVVDDIMTTGATLEACAMELMKIPGVKISFLTIAIGE